jgi:DNA modification methylase
MNQEFVLGSCRLVLGDYAKVLNDVRGVDLVFTSPPYNIGSMCPKITGRRRVGGYDSKSWGAIEEYPDQLPESVYQEQQKKFLRWCLAHLAPNGIIIYNHKPRHRAGVLIKPEKWIYDLERNGELVFYDEVVWDRRSTHNHTKSYVYQQSERLFILCRPGARPYFKNEDFFWNARNGGVGDVWSIPPASSKNYHNAPFPEKLARQCVRMWCRTGGLVVDPYSGSGTTMVACICENRHFVGAEMMENFFQKTVARIKSEVRLGA